MSMYFLRGAWRAASIAAITTMAAASSMPALAGVTVHGGVDVTINQPGVYGRVVLGGGLPPPVLFPQPVIAVPVAVAVHAPPPLYLYVPPGHAKHWHQHCHRYGACNQRVYFVRESWVHERYERAHGHGKPAPVYVGDRGHEHHGKGHGHDHRGKGHGRGDG
jgi:hypothetical protein